MDTEKLFFLNGELDGITFSELSADELMTTKRYVEITTHLIEIHQLYLVFKFNVDSLQHEYTLMNSGDVFRGNEKAEREEDYIAVNAYAKFQWYGTLTECNSYV